ncbi:MAG: cytochrome d ubiquinol oxidase subunit II [Actinobacteria bacterium]|nr:cytochrome d ubiquinol oxidase subunit II [Actinomycetota bacterium]
MELTTFWFLLISILWIGYFFLEGFDFGVGMLLHSLSRDDVDRRVMVNTIAPVWDGNEVWLITAGGATFAAFPYWYATLFSGFYLPLFLILVALIIRGVAFEYRGKVDSVAWRRNWDLAIAIGSWVPAVLWGVAFANIVRGVPIDANGDYTGGFFTLLNPFALLGGVMTAALFVLHGANFLALKSTGPVRDRARSLVRVALPIAMVVVGVFLLINQLERGKGWTWIPLVAALAALAGGLLAVRADRDGWAFAATGVAIAATFIAIFGALFPAVMVSSTSDAFTLTTTNAASTAYTLKIMTWVAVIMTPVVLVYQGWSYWVFRKRVTRGHIPAIHAPGSH